MIIPIDSEKVHKHIIVKARCCSDCGQLSESIRKQYYVSCRFHKIEPLENKTALFTKVLIVNAKEKCQDIYYTVDGTEPTRISKKYQDGIFLGSLQNKTKQTITVKARVICNETGQKGDIVSKDYILPSVQVIALGNKVLGIGNKVLGAIGKV